MRLSCRRPGANCLPASPWRWSRRSRTATSIGTSLGKLVDWHVEQGTDCLAPCGTTGESPTLDHEEHERVMAVVCERAGRPHQGHGRHRLEQHGRSDPHDQGREGRRRQRHAAGRPLLQQADAGGLLPPLRRHRRSGRPAASCFTTSPAAPARTSCRKRSPAWPRMSDDRRREGSDRLARPGQPDRRAVRPHDPQRRRQPDAAADERSAARAS